MPTGHASKAAQNEVRPDQIVHFPRRPILLGQQRVSLGVADDLLAFRIKMEHAPHAVGDLPPNEQATAQVRHFSWGHSLVPAPDAIEEIIKVS